MMQIAFIVVVGLAALVCFAVWSFRNSFRPRVPSAASGSIRKTWDTVSEMQPPLRKVMDAAALFDRTLQELGYRGSLGDKLKVAGKYVPELNSVWRAVKIRNTLAHEIGKSITQDQADEVFAIFRRASEAFLRP